MPIFFTLSGFLVWFSIERSESYCEYLRKRFLRIYPELWLAVAIEVFAIIFFHKKYILGDLLLFTVTQATMLQFWTPDSLRGYGIGTPNGALWTICTLVQFYLIAWFLYQYLKGQSIKRWAVVVICSVLLSYYIQMMLEGRTPEIIVKLYDQTIIRYLWMFFVGMYVACHFGVIIGTLMKYWPVFLVMSVGFDFFRVDFRVGYRLFGTICLFLAIIGFAYRIPEVNLKKDITYGMYLYHCTVINIMFTLGMVHKVQYGILCYLISIVLALLSAFVIKKLSDFINGRRKLYS